MSTTSACTCSSGSHLQIEWRPVAEQFDDGLIGSRECLLDEWDLLVASIDGRLRKRCAPRRARSLSIPGSGRWSRGCAPPAPTSRSSPTDSGSTSTTRARGLGVPILTNAVDWSTGRLEFPHEDRCCPCTTCGVCKQAPVKDARHRGRTTVLVGDGTSDRKAALLADVVFAKGLLARWCRGAGVPFVEFDGLAGVHDALLG